MSSRQTGYRYGLGGNTASQAQLGTGLGNILAGIFGQNKMTGGLNEEENPETGETALHYTPYQGSSGIFGGASRSRADTLNALLGSQVLQQQGQEKLSGQESKQRQTEAKLANELAEHLMNTKAFNDWASSAGLPPDEAKKFASSISVEVAGNLIKQKQNVGAGLESPAVKKATENQLIAEAQTPDARNRAMLTQNATMGGTSHQPGPLETGMGTTVTGATPGGTSIQQIPIGKDKQGNPILSPIPAQITQPYKPGGVSQGIPQTILDQAQQQITPGMGNSPAVTPGFNPTTPPVTPDNPAPAVANRLQTQPTDNSGGIVSGLMKAYGGYLGDRLGTGMKENFNNMASGFGNAGMNILQLLNLLSNVNNPNNDPNATQ